MKKTSVLITSLCALSAAVAMAAGSATSVNAVGYVNVPVLSSNQFVLVGLNFENVGDGGMTLLDIFGTSQLKKSQFSGQVDKVMLWDSVNQIFESYGQKTNGNFYAISGWSTNAPATNKVMSGTSLFLQGAGASDKIVSLPGQVPNYGAITNVIAGNSAYPYYFVCNPYPVAIDIHAFINSNSGARASGFTGSADKMTLWDSASQSWILLGLKSDNKWHMTSGWTTNLPYVGTIDVGQGVLFQSKTNFVWVMPRPF